MKDFKRLEIWNLGMEIVKEIYSISSNLPVSEKFNLASQLTRSAVSIPSNIAEGCSRSSLADYKRFLEISLGSIFELETQLIIIQDLSLIKNGNMMNTLLEQIDHERRMLISLINKLSNDIKGKKQAII